MAYKINFDGQSFDIDADGNKPDTFVGGPEEIRTLDFYNANVALSQLSYRPVNPIIITRGV